MIDVLKNFEKVDPAKVTPTAHFQNELGLDSLDAVEVRLDSGCSRRPAAALRPSFHPLTFTLPHFPRALPRWS